MPHRQGSEDQAGGQNCAAEKLRLKKQEEDEQDQADQHQPVRGPLDHYATYGPLRLIHPRRPKKWAR
jgi:hypothetical protein